MGNTVECQVCGHVGNTKSKGSTLVLILLLLFFFPIGILYWLLNRKTKVCSACSSDRVKLYKPSQGNSRIQSIDEVRQVQCDDCREYIRFDAKKCKHCGSMLNG